MDRDADVEIDVPTCAATGMVVFENACPWVCGNGVVEPGEECDDGKSRNGDGCSQECTLEPPRTDFDGDGNTDLHDFAAFQE